MTLNPTTKKQIIATILIMVGVPAALYFFFWKPQFDCSNSYDPDACYWTDGVKNKDFTTCDQIIDNHFKGSCYGSIIIKTKDYQKCESLDSQIAKNECYFSIAWDIKDSTWCDKIVEDSETIRKNPDIKNNCYLKTISVNTGLNKCEEFGDQGYKDNCYIEIAIKSKNVSACEKISDSGSKSTCYNSIAHSTNDHTLCPFAPSDAISRCYLVIGIATKNPEVCTLIQGDIVAWNNCFLTIARDTRNVELCDRLLNQEYQKSCRDELTR